MHPEYTKFNHDRNEPSISVTNACTHSSFRSVRSALLILISVNDISVEIDAIVVVSIFLVVVVFAVVAVAVLVRLVVVVVVVVVKDFVARILVAL